MSSAAAKKKKNDAAPAVTTGRGAPLNMTLGLFLLALGAALMLSMLGIQESIAMQQLLLAMLGLCGPLYPALPVLLLWGGAKLAVSCRHQVSVRNYFLVFCMYIFILAGHALVARVHLSGGLTLSYMDYTYRQATLNEPSVSAFSACLRQAYELRSYGAGGWLGMLVAFPLTQLLTQTGALVAVGALLIVLAFILFRLHPGRIIGFFSDLLPKRGSGQAQGNTDVAQPPSSQGGEQDKDFTPPDYYQPAPVFNTPYVPAPSVQAPQGFYPVQPDLYEERFPEEEKRGGMEEPAWRNPEPVPAPAPEAPPAAQQPKSGKLSGILNRLKPADAIVSPPEPVKQTPVNTENRAVPARPSAARETPVPAAPASQALDADEDDLPWDIPRQESPKTAKAAAPRPAVQKKPDPPAPVETPASAPAAASWAAQVSRKKAELDLPRHTTQKNEPQQVFTDPVMPLTGEKISITPRRDKPDSPSARLDGTTAPKIKQTSMDDNVPYQAPPIRLLKESRPVAQADAAQEDERRVQIIEGTLRSFGVESEVKQIMHGPSITRFAIQIAPGVKVSKVANTADNLALELKTQHVRVEAHIEGTNYIGIEVPNTLVSTVSLREVLESPEMRANPSPLLVALGKDIAGTPVLCDLSKMPHLLIAGATGSGKSVCINSIVCSLLYRTTPEQVRLIMIDPKQVELSVYNTIPHLLVPVVSEPKKAAGALAWVVQEMLERYAKFKSQGVRNLAGYNKANSGTDKALPNIVVIIDEMADLMEVCRKDVEEHIRRLAALARAAGIYMVLATQRPSVDVITGVIKNNIPSRIAFTVSSGTDSRTIIDIIGAEKLMGKGDMLYKPTGTSPRRVQGCFVSDEEVNAIAEYIGSRYQTDYDPNIVDHLENSGQERAPDEIAYDGDGENGAAGGDENNFHALLKKAIEMAVEDGQTSTSMLQRRLRVGYARAGRLIDEMEKRNIISQSEGSKPRKTLVTREQLAEMDDEE